MPEAHADGSPVIDLPPLTPFDGALEPDGDYDALAFHGRDLGHQRGHRARLTRSHLRECDLDEVDLRDARIAECRFEMVTAGTLDAAGAMWRDVELRQTRIGNFQAFDGDLTRVIVADARLDFVNLRAADLTDVRFARCVITDLDLGSASARRVTFVDCRIKRLDAFQADLVDVDLSTSTVDGFENVGHLRGVTISTVQLAAVAPAMAAHLGVRISGEV
ncbi:MAG TPA: pentapeptide repeat-containing protein [Euzebyales bacterium]|nr:pentapeptide repeat-containing protein [Euzebyales bacterium]